MTEFAGKKGVWMLYSTYDKTSVISIHSDMASAVMRLKNTNGCYVGFWPFGLTITEAIEWWTGLPHSEVEEYDPASELIHMQLITPLGVPLSYCQPGYLRQTLNWDKVTCRDCLGQRELFWAHLHDEHGCEACSCTWKTGSNDEGRGCTCPKPKPGVKM